MSMRMGIYKDEHGWMHLQDNDSPEEMARMQGFVEIQPDFYEEYAAAWREWQTVQAKLGMLWDNRVTDD